MNSIERVMATIQGVEKDRIPLSLTLSLYGAGLTSCPLEKYYTDSKRYVDGQMKVFDIIRPDIIFSPFSLPLFGKAFGSEVRFYENQPPNITKPVVKNLNDLQKLDFERALESPEINYIIESVASLHQNIGNQAVLCAIVSSPLDLPVMLMGIGDWLDLLLTDFDEAKRLIEKTSQFFITLINRLFEKGATGIVLPTIFVNPTIVTKNIAIDLIKQSDDVFSQAHGPLFLHSGGARMNPFLEIYKNMNNVPGFIINSDDNIAQSREFLPDGQVIIGNIEGPDLNRHLSEQVYEKTLEICNIMKNDSHFIFGSSGADIPLDTPIENLFSIRQALEDFSG